MKVAQINLIPYTLQWIIYFSPQQQIVCQMHSQSPFRSRFLKEEKKTDTLRKLDDLNCIVEPQRNLGGIYLGNIESASDTRILNKHRIGAILTVCCEPIPRSVQQTLLMHHVCIIDDMDQEDISRFFEESYEFIEKARKITNVLVHCIAGISRSATILIAYLVRKQEIGVKEAMDFVESRRWQVYPNNGFLRQLGLFERQVFQVARDSPKRREDPRALRNKASIEDSLCVKREERPRQQKRPFEMPVFHNIYRRQEHNLFASSYLERK